MILFSRSSACHPSPFFRSIPLSEHGLDWIHSRAPLAHPFDDAMAVVLEPSVEVTAYALGRDSMNYQRLMKPLVGHWPLLESELLGPVHIPHHPLALTRFAMHAVRSARGLAESVFVTGQARALFGGLAAHSMLQLEQKVSAAFALVLGVAGHVSGWPVPRGGAKRISEALASYLKSLGGSIMTEVRVKSLDELPPSRLLLCDITPRQFLRIAGDRFPLWYRRKLERYRYGLAAFKLDWALAAPIPWKAPECRRAITVHLAGTLRGNSAFRAYGVAWTTCGAAICTIGPAKSLRCQPSTDRQTDGVGLLSCSKRINL